MTKTRERPTPEYASNTPRDAILETLSPERLRGAKVITEPITLAALRRRVAKLVEPEDGHRVTLIVCYHDGAKQWYVYSLSAAAESKENRFLLYVIPQESRVTPFITKRHGQKGYRTLETLIRQFTDMCTASTILAGSRQLSWPVGAGNCRG